MIERIEVAYKVVTPLFGGGADPTIAEPRLPSFKGVLRWWWRALAWLTYSGDLRAIAKAEDELFGSASRGQGKISMRLVPPGQLQRIPKDAVLKDGNAVVGEGARYLGYGVMEAFHRKAREDRREVQEGQLSRACLAAPFTLKIGIRARSLAAAERELLLQAFRAVGLLGGMGAKGRKGCGSLVLQSLMVDGKEHWSPPATPRELENAIRPLLPASAMDRLPAYTALSGRTRIVLVEKRGDHRPLGLLNFIGREMIRFRSWGHNGEVFRKESEKNFKVDHDLMKSPPNRRTKHPQRIVFGLPHNYGRDREDMVGPAGELDRRASPLLIHVHECGTTAVGVVTMLPAMFLPGGDKAKIDVGGTLVPIAPEQDLWKPLNEFLDRLMDAGRRKELDHAVNVSHQ